MGIAERKVREKENRRQEIISAAESIFFEKGFEIATMDEIATKAELSKGTLYLYFNSKEEIHFSIVVKGLQILNQFLKTDYIESKKGNENLMDMGKAYVKFSQQYENYFKAIMHFDSNKIEKLDDEKKQIIFQDESPLVFFIEIIEKGKKDGTIRTDISSAELAIMLWSQTSGILEIIVKRTQILDLIGINKEEMILNNFKILLEGVEIKK